MKKLSKILALVLALALVMSLGLTAFASEVGGESDPGTGPVVTPANPSEPSDTETPVHKIHRRAGDTHTYAVYQVFVGDLSGDILSNIKAGANFNGDDAAAVAAAAELLEMKEENKSEKEIAAKVKGLLKEGTEPYKTINDDSEQTVDAGYYIIVDTTDVSGVADELNQYVVNVASDLEITRKRSETTSEKKVMDKNDTDGATSKWQDTADYDIGDDVPFQLTATLTSELDEFDTYKLTFHDTMDDSLTLNSDSIVVKVGETEIPKENYTVSNSDMNDGCTFEIRFEDVKKIDGVKAGSTITVTYTAKLNEAGVEYGNPGNPNDMHVTFSNNPYEEGEGGKTPDDHVVVFTYKTIVNKVDEEGKALAGAEFTLYKKVKGADGTVTEIEIWTVKGAANADGVENVFEFKGLDDGTYILKETKTPDGYNTMEDLEFTITASHKDVSDDPTELVITELEGGDKFTGDEGSGKLTGDVVNNKGTVLPSTGGMGTTIFYTVGSILMLAAAVLLITRKRMSAYQD